jgi:hypothetical protein
MKRVLHKALSKARKHHKKHMNFLKALRFFEGMPLFGMRAK